MTVEIILLKKFMSKDTHNVIKCCYNFLCFVKILEAMEAEKCSTITKNKEALVKNKHLTRKNFKWYLINFHVKSFN